MEKEGEKVGEKETERERDEENIGSEKRLIDEISFREMRKRFNQKLIRHR